MNSFVMLMTNTWILTGHRPRVSVRNTSLKMGRVFPDTVCSV
jgi:hypothetical protein